MLQRALLVLALSIAACGGGSANSPVTRQADGGYRLTCRSELPHCLKRAVTLCKDEGYVVASAREGSRLLGHDQGQSQIKTLNSEAVVYCGDKQLEPPPPIRLERPAPEPAPRAPAPTAAATKLGPQRVCVPGSTQACVGSAGCAGGQACAADGSHFLSCDCGPGSVEATPTPAKP